MSIQLDYAIALSIFLVSISIILVLVNSYFTSYSSMLKTSELRIDAYNIFNILFGSKGIPKNWEEYNYTPVKLGLITDLYRIPFIITETGGSERSNITVNLSIVLDSDCLNRAWETTIRVYDESNNELESQLYNRTFCQDLYLNRTDLVFKTNFTPGQTRAFFIYFSAEKSVSPPSYFLAYFEETNLTVKFYPEQTLQMVSIDKLMALRSLNYEEVLKTLGLDKEFSIEISEK